MASFDDLRVWLHVGIYFGTLDLRHVFQIVVNGAFTTRNDRIKLVLQLLDHVSLSMDITELTIAATLLARYNLLEVAILWLPLPVHLLPLGGKGDLFILVLALRLGLIDDDWLQRRGI